VSSADERGAALRRQVLGDAHVDRAEANKNAFNAPLQELITRYAWGGVWSREGLDLRARSCVTVAVLAALGRERELELHVRGALRNGLSTEEIAEVLLQTAVYAGIPAANSAFAVAQRVLAEEVAL
jgi:4-carboxymuconolactone decarboxylase